MKNAKKTSILTVIMMMTLVMVSNLINTDPGQAKKKTYKEFQLWHAYKQQCASNNFKKSIQACNQLIKRWPRDKETLFYAYYKRGKTYFSKGQLDRALVDFNDAITHYKQVNKYDPGDAKEDFFFDDGGLDDGGETYSPYFPDAYYSRGKVYFQLSQTDRAIADYNEAIRLSPDFVLALVSRGRAYSKKGQFDKSIIDCTKALKVNRRYTEGYFQRGYAYYKKRLYDKAIADFTEVIKLLPNKHSGYTNRGMAYDRKGNTDRALEDYEKAIKLNPKSGLTFFNIGRLYHLKGKKELAIEAYSKTISLEPKEPTAYGNRGLLWVSLGKIEKAISDFKTAVKLNPRDQKSQKQLKRLGVFKGSDKVEDKVCKLGWIDENYSASIAACTRIIATRRLDNKTLDDKQLAQVYVDRASSFYNLEMKQAAIKDLNRALSLDPNNKYAKEKLQTYK